MSIFVGNLPFRAEQEDVIELFAQFGEVTNCALPLERDTGGGGYGGGGGGGGYGGGGGGGGYGGGGDRPSGARGWEDRSYGARDNAGEGNAYDEGRSRRRRGSSSGGGDDYSGYGGAEG